MRRCVRWITIDMIDPNNDTMIRLNVFIQVKEAQRAEVINVAKELVAASLKDKGCVAYDLFESSTRPDVLLICETWTDETALAAHSASGHFKTLVPKIEQLCQMKMEKFTF